MLLEQLLKWKFLWENEKKKKTINILIAVWVLFLDSTQAQVETRILGPLLVVWWIGLGSPQLNGTDYKPSCAQVT